jgi:hypothetical protein
MWVFCCGMRRSGSTLQFQLAARIAEEAGIGKRIEWVQPSDFPIVREKYKDYPGLKVFKSHIYTPEIGVEFERKNAVGVYIYRDIRDAFLSQKIKDQDTFVTMWMQNFLEGAMDNFYKWTALSRMLVSKYEEVMPNLPREVWRIASHLGINYDESQCRQIADEYTLERQKERIARSPKDRLQHHKQATFDATELLHVNHIYSGEIERWTKELSPWQISLIERKAGSWLTQNGYRLSENRLTFTEQIQASATDSVARMWKAVYYGTRPSNFKGN